MGIKTEDVGNYEKKLLEEIQVVSCGYRISVKPGFVYDGASVPKIFWNIIGSPFTGSYRLAALVHDALYASEGLDRLICDEIFLDIMKQCDAGYMRRYTMYWAVRSGGWKVWKDHKVEEVEASKQFISIEKI